LSTTSPIVSFQSTGGEMRSLARLRPHHADQDADHHEQLRDAQRCNCHHHSRRVAEPADQCELDHHARDDRQQEPGGEPQQVRPAPEDDEAAANEVGTVPNSACAKLTTRLAR
jgi:hypothetical protein